MLKRLLVGETGLLEQVDHHVGSGKLSSRVEVDSNELSESGGVVVPHSLGVTPGLKDRVGLDDFVLKGGLSLLPLARGADGGEVGDDLLGVLGLSGTRLSSNQDGLVDHGELHALVGALGNGEDVRPALGPPLAHVELHGAEGVDGEPLVRVDGDAEEAGVGVDQLGLVPHHGVPQNAGVSEEGEVGHVLGHVELAGVDLADLVALVDLDLAVDVDGDLLSDGFPVSDLHVVLAETLKVATRGLVWNPTALLAIVNLLGVVSLHLRGDLQPWGGVRIRSGGFLDMTGHPRDFAGLPSDYLWKSEASLARFR